MGTKVIAMNGDFVAVAGSGLTTITTDHAAHWFTAEPGEDHPTRFHKMEAWKDREIRVPMSENLYIKNPQGSFAVVTRENAPVAED